MSVILTRSSAELVKLTNFQWYGNFDRSTIIAFLADTSSAATPPTAASSAATWASYYLVDDAEFYSGLPLSLSKSVSSAVYNATNYRAEVPTLTFTFGTSLISRLPSGSHTVTHVAFTDLAESEVLIVGEESPPRVITSSSAAFSYTLKLWGKYAS